MKKKICVVTAARSEYGLLKWLMYDIERSRHFRLQLVVTGGHLLKEQGHTIDRIIEDGFEIAATVDAELSTESTKEIAGSMGRMGEKFAACFDILKPDYLLVLGDRYELLPICSTAFVMRIPIIHLSGGDVTEGAIDDGIRNAVTMLADYHFPATEEAAQNLVRMRGDSRNIWTVGEPGLDAVHRETLMGREELAEELKLDSSLKWGLFTYHAVTRRSLKYNLKCVEECLDALLLQDDFQVVATYANTDFGGAQINEYLEKQTAEHGDRLRTVPSLGHIRYLSFMKQANLVVGNSSSGILEAPFFNIPVVNIGDRQKGRYQCGNIHQYDPDGCQEKLAELIGRILSLGRPDCQDRYYWGDGHTSEKVIKILEEYIK